MDSGYCWPHGRSRGELVRHMAEISSRGVEARRELAMAPRERLRRLMEEDVELWKLIRGAFVGALEADSPDEAKEFRVRTAEALLRQAYGREPVAIVGDPDQPVSFVLDSLIARARTEAA